jgi:hypothetical protein
MILYQETAALQPLLEQFPTQIIRENILRIREFFNGIRELPQNRVSVHFLHTCFAARERDLFSTSICR